MFQLYFNNSVSHDEKVMHLGTEIKSLIFNPKGKNNNLRQVKLRISYWEIRSAFIRQSLMTPA